MRKDFGYDQKEAAGEKKELTKDLEHKVFQAIRSISERVDNFKNSQKKVDIELFEKMKNQEDINKNLDILTN